MKPNVFGFMCNCFVISLSTPAQLTIVGQYTTAHSSDSSWVPKRNKKNKNDDIGRELIGILNN
jgi:hypothetical protein